MPARRESKRSTKRAVIEWGVLIVAGLVISHKFVPAGRRSFRAVLPGVGVTLLEVGRLGEGASTLNGGQTYLNFGFEPFTPANQLRYNTFQVQDNVTAYAGDHELTAGASFERYRSENVFFPGSQSVYVYNSLDDFLADARGYVKRPNVDSLVEVMDMREAQRSYEANLNIVTATRRMILKTLDIPPEKDFTTFEYLGNMGTVSLPLTAAIADERDILEPGDKVAFLGIGSGLNCLMLGMEW